MEPPAPPSAAALGAVLEQLHSASLGVIRRTLQPGQFLFRQAEPADWLFYLRAGNVRLFLLSPDGRERTIRLLGPGDLVGDYAFYLHRTHHAYAQAFGGPVEAFQVSRPALEMLLRARPDLHDILLRLLAHMTLLLAEELQDQTFRGLRERVQIALLGIAGRYGTVGRDGVTIQVYLTHEMIASLVGASRPRVSVCLGELQREAFYHVAGQRIVLSPWAAGLILPP